MAGRTAGRIEEEIAMSTATTDTPTTAPVKITVEPPRAPRKARAPRTPPAPATTKPKPQSVGTPILPAKRKSVPADLKAPHEYVIACVTAPERLATLKNDDNPQG